MELKFSEQLKNNPSMCRLCSKEGGVMSIFDTLDSVTLFEQAMSCAEIQISHNDGLPEEVCEICSNHLLESHRFKIQCETSDRYFRSLIIASKVEVEITPKIEDMTTEYNCSDDNNTADDNFDNDSDAAWGVEKTEVTPSETESKISKLKRRSFCSKCQYPIAKESNVPESKADGMEASSLNTPITVDKVFCSCTLPKARRKGRPPKKLKKRRASEQKNDLKVENNGKVEDTSEAETKKAILRLRLDLFEDRLVGLEQALSLSTSDTTPYSIPAVAIEKEHRKRQRRKSLHCSACSKSYSSVSHLQKHVRRGSCNIKNNISQVKKPRRIIKGKLKESVNGKKDIKIEDNHETVNGVDSTKINRGLSRTHMCDQCGRTFKQRMVLQQHMHTHSDVKMYSCDLCSKRFTRKAHVVAHLRIHDNIKPYVCETCGRSFNKSSDLGRHRRIHSDARNFPCPLCGRGFKRSGDIASHMRSHTGDRPYKCVRCDKSYTTHSSLQKHRRAKCTADRAVAGIEPKPIQSIPHEPMLQQTAYKIA